MFLIVSLCVSRRPWHKVSACAHAISANYGGVTNSFQSSHMASVTVSKDTDTIYRTGAAACPMSNTAQN
jgi:hypothetical protein